MSPDKLTVTPETDEVTVILDQPDEINVTIETKEVEVKVNDPAPDIDIILDSYPDVIVLPTTGLTGPAGPEGPDGPMGPIGPPGTQTTYVFNQLVAATLWNIAHNLDRYPSVTVIDTGGSEIIPNLLYVSDDVVTLFFDNATSGKAYLN